MSQLVLGLLIALGATAAGAGLAVWYLDAKLDAANDATIAAEAAHAAEAESRSEFEAAAAACSAATAGFEARAAAAEGKLAAGKAESEKKSRATAAYVNELLSRGRPAGLDECAAVRQELDDEVDRRRPPR